MVWKMGGVQGIQVGAINIRLTMWRKSTAVTYLTFHDNLLSMANSIRRISATEHVHWLIFTRSTVLGITCGKILYKIKYQVSVYYKSNQITYVNHNKLCIFKFWYHKYRSLVVPKLQQFLMLFLLNILLKMCPHI